MRWPQAVAVLLAVAAIAGCGDDDSASDRGAGRTETTARTTTTSIAVESFEATTRSVVLPPAAASDVWKERFVVPYGDDEHALGVARGGSGGGSEVGPEYGAQTDEGEWFFLDTANKRVARFSSDGTFVDAVAVPRELLVEEQYFQWALPRALRDGSIVAVRQAPGGVGGLLTVNGDDVDEAALEPSGPLIADDGESVFVESSGAAVRVDPGGGAVETPWLAGRNGERYRFRVEQSRVIYEAAATHTTTNLDVVSQSGAPIALVVEHVLDIEGTLHLLAYGTASDDGDTQLAGYLRIGSNGGISAVERVPNPFSSLDPGSPAHLVLPPTGTRASLVLVRDDGVAVFAHR